VLFCEFGVNCRAPQPVSCSTPSLPNPDRLGHAEVGEVVDDSDPNVSFDDLALKAPGKQFITKLSFPLFFVFQPNGIMPPIAAHVEC
jgi:hypothetical protein